MPINTNLLDGVELRNLSSAFLLVDSWFAQIQRLIYCPDKALLGIIERILQALHCDHKTHQQDL